MPNRPHSREKRVSDATIKVTKKTVKKEEKKNKIAKIVSSLIKK